MPNPNDCLPITDEQRKLAAKLQGQIVFVEHAANLAEAVEYLLADSDHAENREYAEVALSAYYQSLPLPAPLRDPLAVLKRGRQLLAHCSGGDEHER